MQKVEALFYAQVLLGCTFHSVPNASIGDAVSFTGWILNLGGGHTCPDSDLLDMLLVG